MEASLIHNSHNTNKKARMKAAKSIKNKRISQKGISNEDMEIVLTLKKLKFDLDCLHDSLNFVTDPILTDSYIYEILSVNMKYKYYLKLCKERGVLAN